jgi:ATP-dependent Clp protease ATP-binding subunit ClpB
VQLKQVEHRLSEKRIQLNFDEKAIKWLGEQGFDPIYGARPLKRVIQTEVLNPLAKLILENKIQPGAKVKVVQKGKALDFES